VDNEARVMPHLPFNTIVFDLDGTLADTTLDLAAALNHSLEALGLRRLSIEQVRALIGHGTRYLLKGAIALSGDCKADTFERGYPIFLDAYSRHLCEGTTPAPGANEAFAWLERQGMNAALCTNKPERLARALVDALGWGRNFAAVIGGDTLPSSKPDPAPLVEAVARAGGGRAVMVGDSQIDAATARAAGIPFIAVDFAVPMHVVPDADYVITNLAQLPQALSAL
jgi:phosphoglycolate phosphatase